MGVENRLLWEVSQPSVPPKCTIDITNHRATASLRRILTCDVCNQ